MSAPPSCPRSGGVAITADEFTGTERFEVVRKLGAGAMGVVYQAYDRVRACMVALKMLPRKDGAALDRFKREFRGLADICHPNLAALHELVVAEECFFTMELVDGVDFITWVRGEQDGAPSSRRDGVRFEDLPTRSDASRAGDTVVDNRPAPPPPSPPPSYDRLRDALRQLAEGVHALHQAGKLHRDIKPSNVMVDRAGRVVLLDFGLITDLGSASGGASDERVVVGTPEYMSPEQGASLPLGPSSDWYAVGTVLYRALTGRLPFSGPPISVLMQKQQDDPIPPVDLVPDTPADLSRLCVELMRRNPAVRPDSDDILIRLGSRASARRRPTGSRSFDAPFIGRGEHAAVLRDAFSTAAREGRAVTVLVRGRSGMGKTILIERVTEELARERGAVVLSGRCYERESVPYKALDSVIDALSRHLAQQPRHEVEALMPRDVLAMVRLFPVLRRVDATKAPARRVTSPDPHELRRRGLGAVRELLARMADRRPLVVAIDDVQWGDLDSTVLLLDLLRPPDPPGLLLVLGYRSEEAEASDAVRHLVEGLRARGPGAGDVREVVVGALARDEARELAEARLAHAGGECALAEEIARESGGDPFLVEQLVRYHQGVGEGGAEVSFRDVMRAQLGQLGPGARRALELCAMAGQPMAQGVIARAAGLAREDRVMGVLRAASLIRTSGAPELGRIETYHDRVRAAVVATLSEDQKRECHLALANALELSERPDPEALAVHLLGGGAIERGTEYAIEAAEKSSAALAFERAAVLYRLAIDALSPEEVAARRLRAALADALVYAGRGVDAAGEYLRAAEGRPAAEALELRRRAADRLLRCGHMDDGLRVLDSVLAAVGMKLAPTPRRAMWSFLRQRMRARLRGLRYRERDARKISPEALTRVDICWSVVNGIGITDPIRGLDFQARHLRLALAAGEPSRIARSIAIEGFYSALGGEATRKRTDRLIAHARRIAERIQEPHARGVVAIARGMADYQTGQWAAALAGFEEAVTILRAHCAGTEFEISTARRFAVNSLFALGSLGELCRRVPEHLAEAESRGDLYAANNMRIGRPSIAWLVADRPEAAHRECERASSGWVGGDRYHRERYFTLMAQTHIDLYVGDGEAAYRRLQERWASMPESMLRRLQVERAETMFLRGRAALAAAVAAAGERRARLVAEVERQRRLLERQPLGSAVAEAGVLAAGLARLRGDDEGAAELLAQAETCFRACAMELSAAAVLYRRGELVGGGLGARLMAESERWMRSQTVRNPAAMARVIVS